MDPEKIVGWIAKIVPVLATYPLGYRIAWAAWLVVTAALLGLAFVLPRTQPVGSAPIAGAGAATPAAASASSATPPKTDPGGGTNRWPTTGDQWIDAVHQRMNELARQPAQSEAALLDALRPLFSRPGFSHPNEEPPARFLFGLYRTQRLLEAYVDSFRNSPTRRQRIAYLTTRIIKLEQAFDRLFGDDVQLHDEVGRKHETADAFLANLPTQLQAVNRNFIQQADDVLKEVADAAIKAELRGSPVDSGPAPQRPDREKLYDVTVIDRSSARPIVPGSETWVWTGTWDLFVRNVSNVTVYGTHVVLPFVPRDFHISSKENQRLPIEAEYRFVLGDDHLNPGEEVLVCRITFNGLGTKTMPPRQYEFPWIATAKNSSKTEGTFRITFPPPGA